MRRSRPEKLLIVNHHEQNSLKTKMEEFDKEKERTLRKISSSQEILLDEIVTTEYFKDLWEFSKNQSLILPAKYRENTQNRSKLLDLRRSRVSQPDLRAPNNTLKKESYHDERRSPSKKYSLSRNAFRSVSQFEDFKVNRDSKPNFAIIENTSSLASSVSDLLAVGLAINGEELNEDLCEKEKLQTLKPCQEPGSSAKKYRTQSFHAGCTEPRMFKESFNPCSTTNTKRTSTNKQVDARLLLLRNHADEEPIDFIVSQENRGLEVERDDSEARSRVPENSRCKKQRRKFGVQHDFLELPNMYSKNIQNSTVCINAADYFDKAACKLSKKEQFSVTEQRTLSACRTQELKIQNKATNFDCGEKKEAERFKQQIEAGSCKLTKLDIEDVTTENRKLLRYHRDAWTGEDARQGLSGNKGMDADKVIRRTKSENNITKAESNLKPGLANLRRLTLKAMAINTFNNLNSKDGEETTVNCRPGSSRTKSELSTPDNEKSRIPKFRQLGIASVAANTLDKKISKPTPMRKISLDRLRDLQKPTQSSLRQSVGSFILPAKPTVPRKFTHSVSDPSPAECSSNHQALANFRKLSHADSVHTRISLACQRRGRARTMPMSGDGPGDCENKSIAETFEDLKKCRYLRN